MDSKRINFLILIFIVVTMFSGSIDIYKNLTRNVSPSDIVTSLSFLALPIIAAILLIIKRRKNKLK